MVERDPEEQEECGGDQCPDSTLLLQLMYPLWESAQLDVMIYVLKAAHSYSLKLDLRDCLKTFKDSAFSIV